MTKAKAYCEDCDTAFRVVYSSSIKVEDELDDYEDVDVLAVEFCPFCGAELDPVDVTYDDA